MLCSVLRFGPVPRLPTSPTPLLQGAPVGSAPTGHEVDRILYIVTRSKTHADKHTRLCASVREASAVIVTKVGTVNYTAHETDFLTTHLFPACSAHEAGGNAVSPAASGCTWGRCLVPTSEVRNDVRYRVQTRIFIGTSIMLTSLG